MAEISAEVPGVLLHLRGRGENKMDVWDLFARNGLIQKHAARIAFVCVERPDESAWRAPGGS